MNNIKDYENLNQKKILLRLDLNVPLKNGFITDETRINKILPIIDGSLTNVVGDNMGKISAWYDNEWGFSNRMCDIVEFIHQNS